MKFIVDDKNEFRTVDEVSFFVSTRMKETNELKIILTEKDQSIENAMISSKVLKLMKSTKDFCKVPKIVVEFKFEGVDETFSLTLQEKIQKLEPAIEELPKKTLLSRLGLKK